MSVPVPTKTAKAPMLRMIAAGGVLLLFLLHAGSVLTFLRRLLHTLRPLLLGVLFATMLHPSSLRLQTDFSAFAARHGRNPHARWIRTVSLIGAILPPLLVLPLFMGIEGIIWTGPIADLLSGVVTVIMAAIEFRTMKMEEQLEQGAPAGISHG